MHFVPALHLLRRNPAQRLIHIDYSDILILSHCEQRVVPGDDPVRLGSDGSRDDYIIIGIGRERGCGCTTAASSE